MALGNLGLGFDSDWTGDPRPPQTAVAIRVFTQVLLVVVLGVVERLAVGYFCCDGAETFLAQHLKEAEAAKAPHLYIYKDVNLKKQMGFIVVEAMGEQMDEKMEESVISVESTKYHITGIVYDGKSSSIRSLQF